LFVGVHESIDLSGAFADGVTGASEVAAALQVQLLARDRYCAPTGSQHASVLQENSGALLRLNFSGDHFDSKPVAVEVGMTEADFSGAVLQSSGAMILAAWLESKVKHTTQTNDC
jgi:hypothetical protein